MLQDEPAPVLFGSFEGNTRHQGSDHASDGYGSDTQRRVQAGCFRIAPTNGLTRHQVASDLWGRLSTPGKWVRAVSEEPKVPAQDAEPLRENEWLRKENPILIDLSRIRKPSGRLFSRRKSEGQKEMAMFFAAQKP